ncbi:MAG: hypothetical protein D6795_02240 [Deltaproteobacteria bacterium]|nr:MAG: hypothetical protein D6795_02240 [Deltaproteobacteria bacterium]
MKSAQISMKGGEGASSPLTVEEGGVFVLYAVDVGYEIDLRGVEGIFTDRSTPAVLRKKLAPTYFRYQKPPVTITLPPTTVAMGGETYRADLQVRIFDFGVMSFLYHLPVTGIDLPAMARLSAAIWNVPTLAEHALSEARRLISRIEGMITKPALSDIVEDYFVFQVSRFSEEIGAEQLLVRERTALAQIIRTETIEMDERILSDMLRSPLSYSSRDLILIDWNAAFIYDSDYTDALNVLEFSNVQLLELRFFDALLDRRIEDETFDLTLPKTPYFLSRTNPYTEAMGEIANLKIEVSIIFERVNNALKLVGDIYLARVHRLAASRLQLHAWQESVAKKLAIFESIYAVMNDHLATKRSETLEFIIILLIFVETLVVFAEFFAR